MYIGHVKCPLFLSDFNQRWLPDRYLRYTQIPNFMKICLVGDKLFHANFMKIRQYETSRFMQISWKSVQFETSCFMQISWKSVQCETSCFMQVSWKSVQLGDKLFHVNFMKNPSSGRQVVSCKFHEIRQVVSCKFHENPSSVRQVVSCKFHENPSSGRQVVSCEQTGMAKLIVVFPNFTNPLINVIICLS